jgi:hypothetical protein
VISSCVLHDFVSDDGDVVKALKDSIRVLASGGIYLIYDKITDGYDDHETESAEGRSERLNVELACLEGKKCWGLHESKDYEKLLQGLGLRNISSKKFITPAAPGYNLDVAKWMSESRPEKVKRWGAAVNKILDDLISDMKKTPPESLDRLVIWGEK